MKNYAEKSDIEINKEVEKLQGMYCEDVNGRYIPTYDYCNDISVAWPIIFENKISICLDDELPSAYFGMWFDDITGSISNFDFESNDENRIRAAMIVYLMMKDEEQ